MIVCESNSPSVDYSLSKLKESRLPELDVIEEVIIDYDLLDAIIIEIHREIDQGNTWFCVYKFIITYIDLSEWLCGTL